MTTTAIIGTQWGDEGKGKIVDALAQDADLIVRYQGGNNAGHTIVVKDKVIKLHLLPSGVVSKKRSLIASGVVLDPEVLHSELLAFEEKGEPIGEKILGIDFRAHLIMPWHKAMDAAREALKGKNKIGTTGRGIGPVYEAKAARSGLRFEDLGNEGELKDKIAEVYPIQKKILFDVMGYAGEFPTQEEVFKEYFGLGKQLSKYECDVSLEVSEAVQAGKKVIFEGAQGMLLDNNFGTYPFVTSSQPIAGSVSACVGIGPQALHEIEGIVKAYVTRVGEGPFPTQILDEKLAAQVREKGKEYGTTTGRPRRVGWYDATIVNLAKRVNGLTGLHLTKLDVLGGLKKIRMALWHEFDGKKYDYFPTQSRVLAGLKTHYVEVDGFPDLSQEEWRVAAQKARKEGFSALPENAFAYVEKIEQLAGIPVRSVSIGPERTEILFRKN